MSSSTEFISNAMSLRKPLKQSLEVLENLLIKADLLGNLELIKKEDLVKTECTRTLFQEFERSFPSICFSIATGIGKTRLMGAFVTYLAKEKGIKNFFILSPNTTIYNKLNDDFGNKGAEKYVFKGLPEIANNAVIINGDNYENLGCKVTADSIQINLFNIQKINADTQNGTPKLKRFRETLGDSYYNYLVNLKDLVIIMDEAHRYYGLRGVDTLNELNPILGIELTATPYFSKEKRNSEEIIKKFRNVVFEYGLKDAINEKDIEEKYIKTPAVVTRSDTDFSKLSKETIQKIKLNDAIQLHYDTKIALETYAIENNKKRVKPIILIACCDTTHAKEVYDYITSNDFYDGIFKDKTLQIDSSKSEDNQIEQLLRIEHSDNIQEIVIHVDMLKEGWDVSNLYTIVPLRASKAKILIEQTIGRGLRLPFDAKATGVEKVDMLSILEHERFQEVLDLAKDKDYNFGQIMLTETGLHSQKMIIESRTKDEVELDVEKKKLETITDVEIKKIAEKKYIAKEITQRIINQNINNKKYTIPNEIYTTTAKAEIIEKIKEKLQTQVPYQNLTNEAKIAIVKEAEVQFEKNTKSIIENNILIPNIKISLTEKKSKIEEFELDTTSFYEEKFEQEYKLIRVTLTGSRDEIHLISHTQLFPAEILLTELKFKAKVDYASNPELFYNLCEQAVNAIQKSLRIADTLNDSILMYKTLIINKIYEQIEQHFTMEIIQDSKLQAEPYTKLLTPCFSKVKDDEILDFKQTISPKTLSSKVFTGFAKSCHERYKFDSIPEKRFAEIIENSSDVIKWLRPASKQFNIWYNNNSNQYVPDFVAETENVIYLIEIKAENELEDKVVKMKEIAAINYCKNASEINKQRKEKMWKYVLIPHNKTDANMTFMRLVTEFEK